MNRSVNTREEPDDNAGAIEILLDADKSKQKLFTYSGGLMPGQLHLAALNILHSMKAIPYGYFSSNQATIYLESQIAQAVANLIKANPETFINSILSTGANIDATQLRVAVENCIDTTTNEANIKFGDIGDHNIDLNGVSIPIACLHGILSDPEMRLLVSEFTYDGTSYPVKNIFLVSLEDRRSRYKNDLDFLKNHAMTSVKSKKPKPVKDLWTKHQDKVQIDTFSFSRVAMHHLYNSVKGLNKKVDYLYYLRGENFLWFNLGDEVVYFFLNREDLKGVNIGAARQNHVIRIPFRWFTRLRGATRFTIYQEGEESVVEIRKGRKRIDYLYLPLMTDEEYAVKIKEQARRVRRCLGIPDLLDLDNYQSATAKENKRKINKTYEN